MSLTTVQMTGNEGQPAPQPGASSEAPAGGELILGKFKDHNALIEAYTALEQRLGAAPAAPAPVATEAPAVPQGDQPQPEAQAVQAGLDLDAIASEYETNGALSEDTYAKLAAAGINRQQADQTIAGRVALAQAIEGRIASSVGGTEALQAVLEWAGANLTDAEATAYEAVRKLGNEAALTMMMQNFKSRYEAANGRVARFINGATVPTVTGVKPIGSQDELVRLMSDPRYTSGDRAYHAEVDARLSVSTMFGI